MIISQPCATVPRRYGVGFESLCFYMQVIFVLQVAAGTLIVTPRNHAVVSGREVDMDCQTDAGQKLKWYRQRPGSPEEHEMQIYNGYFFAPYVALFYTINTSTNGYHILRFNASQETAQRYNCLEPGSLNASSAEVIVLESDPSCEVTHYDGYINITCTIVFRGNWVPVMKWTWCNNETIIISDVFNSTSPNDRLSSSLIIRGNGSNSGTCYRLTTLFRGTERPLGTSADNIPSYNHTNCFKYPEWNNTSECYEPRKNDSGHKEEHDESLRPMIIIGITVTVTGTLIPILSIVYCCCCRKKRKVPDNDANGTLLVMKPTSPNQNKNRNSWIPRKKAGIS